MALAVDVATVSGVFDGLRVLKQRSNFDLRVLRELADRMLEARSENRREQGAVTIESLADALERGRRG